jgi:hypothetical protein
MAAAINGRRRRSGSARLPSPSFLWSYLSSRTNPCASLCLCNTLTHTHEHQFPRAAASGSRRRRRFVAAGERLDPLPVFFGFWDRQELDKLMLSQVFIPEARGSRAPSSPERRPSHRRRRAPLLPPLLRPLARRHFLCAVSIIPRPIPPCFAHGIVSPGSPE